MASGVYFIERGDFVKIGRAYDVRQRFTQLQVASPEPLIPLAFIFEPDTDVALITESNIHRRLEMFRHRGEWFRKTPEVMAFIADVAGAWPRSSARRISR